MSLMNLRTILDSLIDTKPTSSELETMYDDLIRYMENQALRLNMSFEDYCATVVVASDPDMQYLINRLHALYNKAILAS